MPYAVLPATMDPDDRSARRPSPAHPGTLSTPHHSMTDPASAVSRCHPATGALFVTLALLALALAPAPATAIEPIDIRTPPEVAERTAEVQLQALQLPDGFTATLFADERWLANPVCLYLDEQGTIYVAETRRQSRGIEDNRSHPWLLDDLAAMTVDDRLAMYEKWSHRFRGGMEHFTRDDDRILAFTDTTGDGTADRIQVFADGFNDPLDGTLAGILIRDGEVWVTNIPHLWRLRDTTGDGSADQREPLLSGFGVRVAFRGHDMHGLVWGPDGRLYFSIGDRGFHVVNQEGELIADPTTGAVFRCEPDGSGLEMIHRGLRNPQELAFDAYGNLFTGDNNSDAGDAARLVHIVDGGETGWDMAYQYLSRPYERGVFHMDGIWWEPWDHQPAWLLPPVAHVNSGPSGIAYNPGTGLPDRYHGHFFLCDFRGSAGNSGIWTFRVEPEGAGFTMEDHHKFMGETLPTDVDFTYDGRMVVTDLVQGWGSHDLGRIFIVEHEQASGSAAAAEVATLFSDGFHHRTSDQLAALLDHVDMRVRQRAQFALADRGADGLKPLRKAALATDQANDDAPDDLALLRRLHGIWGLGQLQRAGIEALTQVDHLLTDDDPEVRAQMARTIADNHVEPLADALPPLLADPHPRVRFHAALALGRVGQGTADERQAVLTLVEDTGDDDRTLRHAAVMALARVAAPDQLAVLAGHDSHHIRLAALLALARHHAPQVAAFLDDPSPWIALEAASAINRLDLTDAWPALAALATPIASADSDHGRRLLALPDENRRRESLLRRVINANFRLGHDHAAEALVKLALLTELPDPVRLEAVAALTDWREPDPRDRVEGGWRPVPAHRDPQAGARAAASRLADLVAHSEGELLVRVLELATAIDAEPAGIDVNRLVANADQPVPVRLAALGYARTIGGDTLAQALADALAANDDELQAAGAEALAALDPDRATSLLEQSLEHGRLSQQQLALATLAEIGGEPATVIVRRWLDRLLLNEVEPALQLDVLKAARTLATDHDDTPGDAALAAGLERWQQQSEAEGPLAVHRVAMHGGDPVAGRDVLENHLAAQCMRCHKLEGTGGDAGPELDAIADRLSLEKIWESLVDPAAEIADGFGLGVVTLHDGSVVVGRMLGEKDGHMEVATPAGINQMVPLDHIASTEVQNVSSMPPMGAILTPTELRDLVAFLATLK